MSRLAGCLEHRACAPPRLVVALGLLALSAGACKKNEPEGAALPDAGPALPVIRDAASGLKLPLPTTWSLGAAGGEVIGRAERQPRSPPSLVAPRLVVTRQPAGPGAPEEAYRRAMDALAAAVGGEAAGGADGARVKRKALGTRPFGGALAGDLELVYEVPNARGGPGVEVVHRARLLWRPGTEAAELLAVTATYLASDAEWIGAEVQRIFSNLEFEPPGAPEGAQASDGG